MCEEGGAFIFRGKAFRGEKLHRVEDVHVLRAEAVLERTRPFWARAGLTRVADITGMDRVGIPVANAVCPKVDGVSTQHGKGLTLAAAKASAVMETFERHYARNVRLPQVRCSHEDISRQGSAIDPDALFTHFNLPFDTGRTETWVQGYDIVGRREVSIPYALASTGPAPVASTQLPVMSTNGFAAGANLVEAVLQGLCECVERHAGACAAIFARTKGLKPPRVDVPTIPFPEVQDLLGRLQRAGLKAVLRDIRQDIDIFTYQCSLYDPQSGYVGTTTGAGCSLNPAAAMIRALTEAAQARCVFKTGNRETAFSEGDFLFRHTVAKNTDRLMSSHDELNVSDIRPQDAPTFEGDVAICLERLRQAGFGQVIVVDLSPPDMDIAVVRVFVPGLAETPFGFGRLGRSIRWGRP